MEVLDVKVERVVAILAKAEKEVLDDHERVVAILAKVEKEVQDAKVVEAIVVNHVKVVECQVVQDEKVAEAIHENLTKVKDFQVVAENLDEAILERERV
jgi:alkyl hydroperoxide reductase subunit AhpC